ncbi:MULTISPECIES: hypothetical protein [unclassified Rhodococcus (in: high G+C Gram-positive bacteria)]|uniref:hypothetical protein n=1 Tax=unclassified Rhodococcus (in: high G+C Gram-positive bacteria) TaxID=192944 RepID=UPI00111541B8|nr:MULTISPECIES: hypothetical protein [unclassified Rhodococcus (in: high G+C Gram-positive bacteria)]MDV8056437.1 hypothetical protein [Rhodococcus sp. IEGM 1343]
MDPFDIPRIVWADPSPLQGWWEVTMFGCIAATDSDAQASQARASVIDAPRSLSDSARPGLDERGTTLT